MKALVPWLVLLPGLALQGTETRKADPKQALADLARNLDTALAAKKGEEALEIIRKFAAAHRPADKSVELVSADQKVQVVVGANGTPARPDAPEINFTPKGSVYSIAVGGDGGHAAKGAGGKGGSVWLKGKPKGKVLLLGGAGGKGANATQEAPGGAGGSGGDVWHGSGGDQVTCHGGPGGTAGTGTSTQAGGAGGNGGNVGAEPAKKH